MGGSKLIWFVVEATGLLITRTGATEEGRRCESPSFCVSHVFKHIQEELCGHMIPDLRKV